MLSLFLIATGAFAYKAMADGAAFVNMTWSTVTVGEIWPIQWTPGDGTPVSLFLGNASWNTPIFSKSMAQLSLCTPLF
jgi:hypothetical protein